MMIRLLVLYGHPKNPAAFDQLPASSNLIVQVVLLAGIGLP